MILVLVAVAGTVAGLTAAYFDRTRSLTAAEEVSVPALASAVSSFVALLAILVWGFVHTQLWWLFVLVFAISVIALPYVQSTRRDRGLAQVVPWLRAATIAIAVVLWGSAAA